MNFKKAKFNETSKVVVSNSLLYKPLNLTLNEARLFFMLVSQIEEKEEEFKTHKIFVKDLISIINPKSKKNLYAQVKRDMLNLENKKFDYTDGNKTAPIRLLVEPVYHEQEGCITARIHHLLKPDLLKLKREFTVGLLCEMLRFKSFNTQRIYLLVKQYQNAKIKVNKIDLEDFKYLLGLEGKYPRFNDFKKRVLIPAQEEITATGLKFEIKEHRSGRTVDRLSFIIKETATDLVLQDEIQATSQPENFPVKTSDEKLLRLKTRLEGLKLSPQQVRKILALPKVRDSRDVWGLINEIRMELRDGKIKASLGGYAARKFDNKFSLGFFAS